MKKSNMRGLFLRVLVPGSGLLALGGCGLSDQQLTGILSTVISSGLTTFVNALITGLAGGAPTM
jgi:hypothetical protein